MSFAWISHPDCLLHEMGPHHPERPARLKELETIPGQLNWECREAPIANRSVLLKAHSSEVVDRILRANIQGGYQNLDPDTALNSHSANAALRAAGAGILGVDLLCSGEKKRIFCAVRPPGHHAERNQSMGFCLFNNIAIAALYALEEKNDVKKIERILIVDFDVHHGNGTEDILKNDKRVMICQSFQYPFYPGTPFEKKHPRVINTPLPAGTDSQTFRDAVKRNWFDQIVQFKPNLLFFSAGFDGHRDDPLGGFSLVEDDYFWITDQLRILTDRFTEGRIMSFLEGGYDLASLGRSVFGHVKALSQI